MYSVKISEYLPQICVGNEQGTHFLKGEEATLIPAQISLLGCRRERCKVQPARFFIRQAAAHPWTLYILLCPDRCQSE